MLELVREDPDIDTVRRANEAEHRIAEKAIPPRVEGAMPDENLCNAFVTRKLDNRGDRIVAFQHFGGGAGLFRRIEIPSNRGSPFWTGRARTRTPRRVHLENALCCVPRFQSLPEHWNAASYRRESVRASRRQARCRAHEHRTPVVHPPLRRSAAGRVREALRAGA